VNPLTTLRSIWKHPANRGKQAEAIARYFWWQSTKRLGRPHFDLPFHGLKLRCHADSHSASAALYFSGLPDYREMQFIRRYLRPGDCFIDVGANVGVYTLLAASIVGPAGTVHAFEPMPRTHARLRENVEINGLAHVSCHGIALSEHVGPAQFAAPVDDSLPSLAYGQSPAAIIEVQCSTLDSAFPEGTITMMKLDVEGAEPLILRGASQHLAAGNPPVIQIEMDGFSTRFGIETHDFIDEIVARGYDIAIYDPDEHRLIATRRPWEHRVLNVLAIHQPSRDFVEQRLASETN
jgi:FkbM family methyltransferase